MKKWSVYLAKLGGTLATAIAVAGSPIGVNVFGAHTATIVVAVGQLLHAFGVHLDRPSATP